MHLLTRSYTTACQCSLVSLLYMVNFQVAGSPTNTTQSPPSVASGIIDPQYALTEFTECKARGLDIQHIKDGFSEMIEMIGRDDQLPEFIDRYPKVDWLSSPAIDFWGPAEKSTDWREHIQENLDRAAAITYQYWFNPFAPKLRAVCNDPLDLCTCDDGTTYAYTILHVAHINFCPAYFTTKTLADAVNDLDDNKPDVKKESQYLNKYINRASVWAHEIMHVGDIGIPASPFPGIIDVDVTGWPSIPYERGASTNTQAYGTSLTKWLAQAEGNLGSDPVDNADNYALFYLANYIFKKKGFYPHEWTLPLDPTRKPPDMPHVLAENDPETDDPNNPFDYEHYCYNARQGDARANAITTVSSVPSSSPSATPTAEPCVDGSLYADLDACSSKCSGQCNQNAAKPSITCSCDTAPATTTLPLVPSKTPGCQAGTYDKFEECASQCGKGQCNESAGKPVTCICP